MWLIMTLYVEQNKATSKLIQRAKENYHQEQLETSNSKNIFATMNKLLNNNCWTMLTNNFLITVT